MCFRDVSGRRLRPPAGWMRLAAKRQTYRSLAAGESEEILDERSHGGVPSGDLPIRGFDDEVLIGGVRPAAVAKPEMAGGQSQRVAGEDVAGVGAGVAGNEDRVDLMAAVH